jgi:hypothetical protein
MREHLNKKHKEEELVGVIPPVTSNGGTVEAVFSSENSLDTMSGNVLWLINGKPLPKDISSLLR